MTPGNRDDNVADPQIGGTEAAALMPGRPYPEIIDLHSQQQNPDTIEEIGFNCDCMSQRESLTVSSGQNPRRNFDGRCAQRVKIVQRPASPAPQASGPMTHQPLRKARHHALFLFHHHRGNFPRSFVWRGPRIPFAGDRGVEAPQNKLVVGSRRHGPSITPMTG